VKHRRVGQFGVGVHTHRSSKGCGAYDAPKYNAQQALPGVIRTGSDHHQYTPPNQTKCLVLSRTLAISPASGEGAARWGKATTLFSAKG